MTTANLVFIAPCTRYHAHRGVRGPCFVFAGQLASICGLWELLSPLTFACVPKTRVSRARCTREACHCLRVGSTVSIKADEAGRAPGHACSGGMSAGDVLRNAHGMETELRAAAARCCML